MTREENLHWIDQEIQTWENECQSKHPIKEALHAARKALEQKPCEDAVSVASVFEIMGNIMSIPYDFDRSITEKDVSESMDKIRVLPRVTPQESRWIPVTERLPDNATNGDMIKAMFPYACFEEYEDECRHIVIMWADGEASIVRSDFEWDWWNALYKGGNDNGNDD